MTRQAPPDDERTVTVHVAANELEARAVTALLEQAEIPHVSISNLTASGYPLNIGTFAEIPIRVFAKHADEARQLIADWKKDQQQREQQERDVDDPSQESS